MENIIIAVHVLAALSIIGLILLQQGKGAEMGASFGSGSSQTLFGPQGSGTIFSHATAILTAVFFATSIGLATYAKHRIAGGLEEGIPSAEVIQSVEKQATKEKAPANVPAASDSKPAAPESDIPKQ
jgi:preprotein translocase subunit SecG